MAVIEIQARKSTNQLGGLLQTLYEDVLLLCENDENKLSNNTSSKKWKKFVASNQVQLIYNNMEEKGKFKLHNKNKKDECIVIDSNFIKEGIDETIIFCCVKKHVFSSLFSHIRNAFAHNQIFVDENREYITMYDRFNQKSTVFTMIAHLKIKTLEQLIETIKNIK